MVEVSGTSPPDDPPACESAVGVSANDDGRTLPRPPVSAAEAWLGSVGGE